MASSQLNNVSGLRAVAVTAPKTGFSVTSRALIPRGGQVTENETLQAFGRKDTGKMAVEGLLLCLIEPKLGGSIEPRGPMNLDSALRLRYLIA
jgi:hypothetical protein